ncbi:hypothetical protein DFJ63DRAFT_337957 [Scheffersomyces coipomensis]|uniref:uncharacterized protein n=1 Tax=Scheffersomyces coipomensis TaxID=1788519 RepID=UPI00315DD2EF
MTFNSNHKFLILSNEISEPFVIPNVSPVSSPQLLAIPTSNPPTTQFRRLSNTVTEPIPIIDHKHESESEATLVSERDMFSNYTNYTLLLFLPYLSYQHWFLKKGL